MLVIDTKALGDSSLITISGFDTDDQLPARLAEALRSLESGRPAIIDLSPLMIAATPSVADAMRTLQAANRPVQVIASRHGARAILRHSGTSVPVFATITDAGRDRSSDRARATACRSHESTQARHQVPETIAS